MLGTSPKLKKYSNNTVNGATAEELVEKVFGKEGLYQKIEHRWEAYKAHQAWDNAFHSQSSRGQEPTFVDEETGEKVLGDRALDPCDIVNETLSNLVGLCIEQYKEGVVKDFFKIVKANPNYAQKLKEIPLISAYSEGEMEKYYAQKALDRFEEASQTGHDLVKEIKQKAEDRLIAYFEERGDAVHLEYNEKEKRDMVVADFLDNTALQEEIKTARKLYLLDETIQPFPYTHNYEHLAYGEKHLLENPVGHGNFPKALLKTAQATRLPANDPEGTSPEATAIKQKNPDLFGIENIKNKYMTFVGSGALPLTGFVHQAVTGCKINLVDVDPKAVELSQKLRNQLVTVGALEKDAVQIYIEHGNQVYYGGPRVDDDRVEHRGERFRLAHPHYSFENNKWHSRKDEDVLYLPTDVLYIASLIPNNIKKSMIRNLEENTLDSVPVTVVRSARGLSGMLYEPIHDSDKDLVGASALYHDYGNIAPQRHTVSYINPHTAVAEDYINPVCVSAIVSDDNVNTAHIYYRKQLPVVNADVVFLPGSGVANQLEKDLAEEGKQVDYSFLYRHGPKVLQQMKQEMERFAKDNGLQVDTSFLNKRNLDTAETHEQLIDTYRQMVKAYGETCQQIGMKR